MTKQTTFNHFILHLSAGVALLLAPCAFSQSNFTEVVVPQVQTVPEKAATSVLVEETTRRTPSGSAPFLHLGRLHSIDAAGNVVVLAAGKDVDALLPAELIPGWHAALDSLHATPKPEGFSILTLPWRSGHVTVAAGNDERGELFAAGWLLRHMTFQSASAPQLPLGLHLFTAPEKPVRGQQIGYRAKNNTYDAWTLPQFEQHIRELALFGNNTIQLISPVSDDAASSPNFHAPALETVIGISAILQKYGLRCDLYYPELRADYSQPTAVAAELADFEALVRAMPSIDSVHIPGGDPGHTPPQLLFPLVEKEAAVLHKYHPGATLWVSAQGFDAARFAAFYKLLDARPNWLTGVFFGPQSRDSFPVERQRIPPQYPLEFYPDIAHVMHAQFPVPQWDPIFALTEGREPICPRPAAFAAIYRRFAPLNSGFITYSEGVNDHVNQILFDALGWSSSTSVDTILAEYASFFLRREGSQNALAVRAIKGLEQDWNGPIATNREIPQTAKAFDTLAAQSTKLQTTANGEWESLLYRAAYDLYLQLKSRRERTEESLALAALRDNDANKARAALTSLPASTEETRLHDRLFTLAAQLFHDWGLQLSVPRFQASNWERGANLDRVDTPVNDAAWITHAIDQALAQPTETARNAALHQIANWQQPTPGTLYDDLGNPTNEPHLLRGEGWAADPELYHTAIDGIADRTLAANPSPDPFAKPDGAAPWRLSWLTYAETLYETPLQLHYDHLDPRASWHVRITYAGEDYALPLRLTASNGLNLYEIHPARQRHANPETVEFPIPAAATANGTLTLTWLGPAGSPGSGRGRQVAEVWLIPTTTSLH